ncbi:MAG: LacI family transcriptional regulator [Lachnospiraceae bacterium]|nr:LacI family transcriptional regulator [Lachnospiraceae bacterium]
MANRVTLKEIAERMGTSTSTVSKALNNASDISTDLKNSIIETAVKMGYKNRNAFKEDKRKLILFIENMEYKKPSDFGYDIILGFKTQAAKENYTVDILPITPDFQKENHYDSYMMQNGYNASFGVGFSLEDPWMEEFKTSTFPTALLDNIIQGTPNVCNISTDSDEGIELAIEHLIKLGHEKIGFLNGSTNSYISNRRMSAFLKSMSKNHLPIDPALAIYGYFIAEAAPYHVPNLISAGATAIVCGNDLIAKGVIDCLKDMNLKVPEDVSVIGFDDLPMASTLNPPLTTIKQDRVALGVNGYFVLYAMLNNVSQSKSLLRPSLIVRESTAVCKMRIVTEKIVDKDSVMYQNPELFNQRF